MRRFMDPAGLSWDVVVGRASWGALFALFVPVGREAPVRQHPLDARSAEQAEAWLDDADAASLAALLERSTLKDE